MDNDILKGLKIGVGIFISISVLFGIVFAVGFHSANEIIGGVFQGNYTFNGTTNFTQTPIWTNKSLKTGWPDIIECSGSNGKLFFVLNNINNNSNNNVVYMSIGDYGSNSDSNRIYFGFNESSKLQTFFYHGPSAGWTGWYESCNGTSLITLESLGKTFNIVN